jgi:benzoyl-CoA reductase/2-hydroxyglutaryl-CoA dehydratase subunit BcrC/BadD/HgdB
MTHGEARHTLSRSAGARYRLMRDLGAPVLMRGSSFFRKKRVRRAPDPALGPPLACSARLREIMTRHYLLARYAKGALPVAWVTSGAPVELLRAFGFYTVYPENHGALCGAKGMGAQLCRVAEEHGYSQDLCSYARIDLAVDLSGQTPVGRLPKPDLLFASNNICQTVAYWYTVLSERLGVPLLLFDTPFNYTDGPRQNDRAYMVRQIEEMIPVLERVSGRAFRPEKLKEVLLLAKETAETWGAVLATMKARPAPMTIFDAFVHLAPVVSLRGLPVALDYYRILLRELRQRIERGQGGVQNERVRLLWDNIAIWPRLREFASLFAGRNMCFVTATYTNAWAETAPYMEGDDPLEAMAETYSRVILNNSLGHRLALMEGLVRDYHVDGIVIHSARSCKPYSVGQYDLKRFLAERLNIPSVVLEADIADERAFSEEQIRTRLEAFFETLERK